VRGSIPSPGPATSRFGGNTACVEIHCGDERIVFDAGSGVRPFGDSLTAPVTVRFFISHYHYDHLQGLPFFGPIFDPRNTFLFYGPTRNGLTVRDAISRQMQQPYFPVTADMVFRARLEYRAFREGDALRLGGATVTALELNHPGGSLGYRVDFGGRSIVYATDIEHGSDHDLRLADFARGTDVLIYDAMYTEDEYRGRQGPPKAGWGHSTWQASVEAANRAGAKQLVLFHHEPTRDDAGIEKLLRAVRKLRPEAVAARESQVIAP